MFSSKGWDEEEKRLAKIAIVFDEEIRKGMDEVGFEMRDIARDEAPYATGTLKRSIKFDGTEREGETYKAVLYSNLEYAPHVEYGHRQEVGKYIPALGKTLVKRYIKGFYFMQKGKEAGKKQLKPAMVRAIKRAKERLEYV
ncbi:hypothetical protein EUAN_12410 [Andreesenia angusta]|uniref:HK97 gp10 family phage protein n=1 Tax=Andreesenia angusta TaxID=39480 RepID=A0A1S1V6L3_9FIRM|nr:HK97 gp10 family phage protein [Andreesenia angusta]OHW62172.1 hypothetical protein EUAN_12410 [Andreesenia angusta]